MKRLRWSARFRALMGNNLVASVRRIVYTLLAAHNASNAAPLTALTGTTLTQVATSPVTIPVYASTVAAGTTLATIAAGQPAIPYAGYRGGQWYATDSLGGSLGTAAVLASGLTRYTGGGQGNISLSVLNEPAGTNKITTHKANPTVTTNLTKGGNASAVLSIVDDTAALTAAGLIGICTLGDVYLLDNNQGGSGPASVGFGGATGDTAVNTAAVWVRKVGAAGTASLIIGGGGAEGVTVIPNSGTYSLVSCTGTPATTGRTMQIINVGLGDAVYFILPRLVTESVVSSPIYAATETLAAVTRAARYTTILGAEMGSQTRGQLVLNDLNREQWVIGGAATAGLYVSSANKLVATDGTTTLTSTTTLAAGTIYDWGVDWPNGVLYINGSAEATNATLNTPSWAATVLIGAKIGATNILNGYVSVLHSSNDPIAGGTN